MLQPLFEQEEQWGKLMESMHGWLGTPFRHYCRVKGRGVDCALLVGEILMELGILTGLHYNYYARDWHKNANGRELVVENVISHVIDYINPNYAVMLMNISTPKINGDWLGFCTIKQKVTHHSAIWFRDNAGNEKMLHSIRGKGVHIENYGDFWKEHVTRMYRVYEVIG